MFIFYFSDSGDFTNIINYYLQEEIEIEAKVVKERGRLILHVVEVRRKNSGELIAIGKQWMASKGQVSTSRL